MRQPVFSRRRTGGASRRSVHDVGLPRFRYQIFVPDRPFHQCNIDLVPDHQVGDFAGIGADDVKIDVGMGAVKNARYSAIM
jgi:hypothetical protein